MIIGDVTCQVAIEKDITQQENGMKGVGHAHRPTPSPPPGTEHANPWISGSFYLVAAVVMMTVIAVISMNVSWYVLPVVIIGGILFIVLIGALQLMLSGKLTQDNFVALIREILKHLYLLKR